MRNGARGPSLLRLAGVRAILEEALTSNTGHAAIANASERWDLCVGSLSAGVGADRKLSSLLHRRPHKAYNDRYGHPAGDRCLALVVAALRSAVSRPNDFVARYGGEEMAMILPDTDAEGARNVAERARQAVLGAAIVHEDNPLGRVTISLGISSWRPVESLKAAELLSEADQALYAAKEGGRNRVVIFSRMTVP
ncbi:MAG: hypothetical protein DI587_24755 [Variovorax paradoxus]|nr:MAG: hypothetical protein DI583_24755 [Variovorax paradoxus]PZQ05427.1 MAG: hypothetical protein DI587_24755 [Variovorax paradoxus]